MARKLFRNLILGETSDTAYPGNSGKNNAENISNIFSILDGMADSDSVTYYSVTKFVLKPGKAYAFESAGDEYKVQLYDEDGTAQTGWDGAVVPCLGGLILYPSSGMGRLLAIKDKPTISLSTLLNIDELMDNITENSGFTVNTAKPNIYLQSVDGSTFSVWEITGAQGDVTASGDVPAELLAHLKNISNPHEVTAEQTGAAKADLSNVTANDFKTKFDESGIEIPDNYVTQAELEAVDAKITKNGVGLGNVDNTSDMDKPVSTAVQAALSDVAPAYTYGTDDLEAGTSSLETGRLHFVYE